MPDRLENNASVQAANTQPETQHTGKTEGSFKGHNVSTNTLTLGDVVKAVGKVALALLAAFVTRDSGNSLTTRLVDSLFAPKLSREVSSASEQKSASSKAERSIVEEEEKGPAYPPRDYEEVSSAKKEPGERVKVEIEENRVEVNEDVDLDDVDFAVKEEPPPLPDRPPNLPPRPVVEKKPVETSWQSASADQTTKRDSFIGSSRVQPNQDKPAFDETLLYPLPDAPPPDEPPPLPPGAESTAEKPAIPEAPSPPKVATPKRPASLSGEELRAAFGGLNKMQRTEEPKARPSSSLQGMLLGKTDMLKAAAQRGAEIEAAEKKNKVEEEEADWSNPPATPLEVAEETNAIAMRTLVFSTSPKEMAVPAALDEEASQALKSGLDQIRSRVEVDEDEVNEEYQDF